jgi:hypothetical protein
MPPLNENVDSRIPITAIFRQMMNVQSSCQLNRKSLTHFLAKLHDIPLLRAGTRTRYFCYASPFIFFIAGQKNLSLVSWRLNSEARCLLVPRNSKVYNMLVKLRDSSLLNRVNFPAAVVTE